MKPRDFPARGVEIGAPRARVEDAPLLIGRGRFVDDRAPPGCLHLAFARSQVARGRVRSLEVQRARASHGVLAVLTASELGAIGPIPVNVSMLEVRVPQRRVLASADVRYVGEPLAAVVATTREAAADAAECIEIEIDAEPPRVGAQGGSEAAFTHEWRSGDVAAAFAAADEVVQARIAQPLVAAAPLEPRAMLAQWDAAAHELTVWVASQAPHRLREHLARLLGLDPARVHALSADVGGAFGSKASLYPEEVVTAWTARHLARPVKWIASRGEDLLSASHGRGAVLHGELALKRDGTFLGLRAELAFPLGAWMPFSGAVPAWNAGRILPGPYAVANVAIRTRGVPTDTAPVGIYRGAGRPEAAALMERLVDQAACAIGLDAAALRRRNLLPAARLPGRTPTGETLDSGDYAKLLDLALGLADYPALCRDRERRRAAGELYGIGIGFYVEPCGRGAESARVRLEAGERAVVASGTSPQGQGHATTFAQIAADALALPFENITVVQGDTRRAPPGIGALASRSTAIGGSAVLEAARRVRERAQRGEPLPIEESVHYAAPGEAWSAGCCLAALSIDADTGEIRIERFAWADDAGRIVNPLLAHGQLWGGFAQGLGQALMERLVHDAEGQLLTGSFMDYAVPRAADVPPVAFATLETASRANSLGAKGVGESGAIGVPAALLNAALDALAPRGVRQIDFPLTAESLWRATWQKESGDEVPQARGQGVRQGEPARHLGGDAHPVPGGRLAPR